MYNAAMMDDTTTTDESPIGDILRDEERELANYLDELISATLAKKAHQGPATGRGTNEPALVHVGVEERQETATREPTPEAEAPQQKVSPSARKARGTARASMSEGLMALFRNTERPSPHLPTNPVPSTPTTATDPGLTANQSKPVSAAISGAGGPFARDRSLGAVRPRWSPGRRVRPGAASRARTAGGRQDRLP